MYIHVLYKRIDLVQIKIPVIITNSRTWEGKVPSALLSCHIRIAFLAKNREKECFYK